MRSHAKASSSPGSTSGRGPAGSRTYLCLFLATIVAALLSAAPAQAEGVHPPRPALSHEGLGEPCGTATDSQGNLYVAKTTESKVEIFKPDGSPLTSFATPLGGPCSIAVGSAGDVYVGSVTFHSGLAEAIGQNVAKYKPGEFPPTPTTTYSPDTAINGTGVLVSSSHRPTAVAVDPETQHVLVAEPLANEMQRLTFTGFATGDKFKLTANGEETAEIEYTGSNATRKTNIENALVAKLGAGNVSVTTPNFTVLFKGSLAHTNIAQMSCVTIVGAGTCQAGEEVDGSTANVSSFQANGTPISSTIGQGLVSEADFFGVDVYGETGNVYVSDRAHGKAYVLNPAGTAIEAEITGAEAPAGGFGAMSKPYLAVDQSNGHVLVSDASAHGVVDEFDEDGVFVTEITHTPAFAVGTFVGPDIAVDNGSASPNQGNVYVSSADGHVYAFGPLPGGKPTFPLTVKKAGAGAGSITSAPTGIDCGSSCEAEFAEGKEVTLTAVAGIGSTFAGWSGCDSVLGEECKVTIATAKEVTATFNSRPLISEQDASQITATSVRLDALVNPKGKATSYRFEYLTEAAWQANGESFSGPQPASKAPSSPVAIGSGTLPVAAGIKVTGLSPASSYRFRVTATNAIGTAEGERDGADEEIPQSFATYALPQVFSGDCPANETLRSGPSANLPDCRAWEQASPIDKNAGNVQGTAPLARAAEQGGAISFESAAGIPGGEGSQNFPTYVATRDPGGWATRGSLPSASAGQNAKLLGWTPDFATVFDEAEIFGQGNSLLARSIADGSETGIVPHTSPSPDYRYIGSSKDATTVLFEAAGAAGPPLTPDAAPGKPNVYAWDRDSGDLRLAGVLPDGSAPAQGSRAIVPAGGTYAYDTHRVAADGSVFFNDVETGQLYVRENPGRPETTAKDGKGDCVPDPVLACTVHVSASQKKNGGGINGHDAAGPQPATFMAASPDGSIVTFLGSEKLTDDATTGPEPTPPSIARADSSDGGGKDVEFLPAFAHEIAIDKATGYVYWTDPAHDRIGRSKLDKTEFDESFISGIRTPLGIAVIDEGGAEYVFWTSPGEGEAEESATLESELEITGEGTIGRADLDGGNADEDCLEGVTNPRSIAADSGHLYWTSPGRTEAQIEQGKGKVGRASLACDSVVADFAPDFNVGSGDIAVDASHIYVSRVNLGFGLGLVYRLSIDGTGDGFEAGFEIEVPGTQVPPGLALDGSHLYWANRTAGVIGRSDLDGTVPSREPNFITGAERPEDLATDSSHVYWSANQGVSANPGTDLYQLDRESGELTDLAPDTGDANGVEMRGVLGASEDGSYVYFVANGVPDDLGNSPNANGESAQPGNCKNAPEIHFATGICNLYVAHAGEVDFIARLDATSLPGPDANTGDAINWIAAHTEASQTASDKTARVSADGRVLLFRSRRMLTDYDNQGPSCRTISVAGEKGPGPCLEFYRFDYEDKGLACLSCDPRGEAPTGPARLASLNAPTSKPSLPAATLGRNLSRDGKRFFFETPDALVAADTNGEGGCLAWGSLQQEISAVACQDVYEWEAPGKGSCSEASPAFSAQNEGCIYLISTGKSPEASFFADADLDGDNVFVFTFEQLVGQDEDALLDVYDARVGGGLAGQNETARVPCEGEGCRGPASAPPGAQSPGSASLAGAGNVRGRATRPSCPKGKRRVRRNGKARCVPRHNRKEHRGQKRRNNRAANTTGRAGR